MFYNLTFAKLNFHNFANWMFYAYIRFHVPQFAKCISIHCKKAIPNISKDNGGCQSTLLGIIIFCSHIPPNMIFTPQM